MKVCLLRINFLAIFILLLFFDTGRINAQNSSASEIIKERNAEISLPMNDGVNLATEVFLPKRKRKGEYPVVLVRTPYNKAAENWLGKAFTMFGIAVVTQDCRGKFKSEGDFYPFINERSDGLQTLRWIREQEWCNGVIAGWGTSYVGYTQWAISDSLDFLTLVVTGANIYDFTYPSESFSLQSAFTWGFQNAASKSNSISVEKMKESLMILPLSAADDSTIKDIPFINDWIAHDSYDDYWKKMNFRGITEASMISMAGWYDIFLNAQICDFQASVKDEDTNSRLIIGPWCHGSMGEANDYGGLKKTGKPQKIFKYVNNHLKGRKNKLSTPLKDARYNLFIMERNEYVGSDVWPPEETDIVPFYVGPHNYLQKEQCSEKGNMQYTYFPDDPYPSHGGTALGDGVGPARQNENIGRTDQLVFQKEPQEEPLILLGPISSTLWLGSDAPCTDFVVQIQDVFQDGKIINIQEGIARIEFKENLPQKTEISVWATGYQLNPGHSLRIVISSSWFPRFNRSLNTCEPSFNASDLVKAEQKVYFGPEMPSSINLPVYTHVDK